MTDFFTRLVSRTLSGLEPTVKPLIAPIYASGVTMADNYAVDPASELGFSVSGESDSEEYPMGQSPELLGISAAETLSLASNVTPINWEQIQLPNHPLEITSSEQVQLDNAIATENSIQTASSISGAIPPLDNSSEITPSEQLKSDSAISTESSITASSNTESSSPITPTITQSPTIQKLSNQETVNLNPTIQPRDHSSEIASNEQFESDNAIANESTIRTNSFEISSTSIQESSAQNTNKVNPTVQPLDNSSSEQLERENAIAPEESIKTSSAVASSSPITLSITPPKFIQQSNDQSTDNVNSTIQPQDNSSGEQLEIDNAIASRESIKTSSSEESSLPITSSVTPPSFIQKSSNQNASNVNPTVQPLDNSSEGQLQQSINQNTANVNPTIQPLDNYSGEQLEIDNAITPEESIRTNSSEILSPSIQKLTKQDKVTPTVQSLDNSSEIASSEQLEIDNAITPEESIRTNSSEILSLSIQKLTKQDKVTPTVQSLYNSSDKQVVTDNAIAPRESIKTSSVEESSSPITPSITPPSFIQKLSNQNTDNVTSAIQQLDNFSGEQLQSDNAIAPEESIKTSSAETSPSPITTSVTPASFIQKSSNQNSFNVTPTIQPLDNSSDGKVQLDNAIAPRESTTPSSDPESSSQITPSITPPNFIQQSSNQNTDNVNSTIQPRDNFSEIASSEQLEPDNAIAPDNVIKASSTEESSSLITTSTTTANIIQKLSSSNVKSASSKIQPVAEIGRERSQTLSETPTEPSSRLVESQVAESSSSLQLNNQSVSERTKKVSLPLVKSEVMAPFSNSPLNLPEQLEPPVNRGESIQSIEINPALEANISATSSSLPQEDQQIFSRAPIASETVSQSPGSPEIKTGAIKPQSSSLIDNAPITSFDNPQQDQSSNLQETLLRDSMTPKSFAKEEDLTSQQLTDISMTPITTVTKSQNFSSQEESLASLRSSGITTQSKLVAQEVRSQQISESKSESIESNLSSLDNNINSLGEKYLATAKPRLSQTNGVTLTIEPRIENTHPELFQLPEKSSDFAFPSNSELPPRQLSPTRGSEAAIGSPRKIANTTAESTPTINISIGRVEVRGVKPPDPAPVKKSRAKTPQLSLSDYLNQRGGISP